jgi:dihydropteroate synthase
VVDVSGNLTGTLPDAAAAVAAVVLIHSQMNDHKMSNCPLIAKINKQLRNTFKKVTSTKFIPPHPSAWTSILITNTNFISI